MSQQLFRSVFRSTGNVKSTVEFSPMSYLADTLDAASIRTPRKKLSLSSLGSDSSSGDLDIPSDFDDRSLWQESPEPENQNTLGVSRKRRRNSQTPLREIQNQMECSPLRKYKKARNNSAMKSEHTLQNSPLDKDSTSRDSGYSESETKVQSGICRSLPKPILPKLNLDSSPAKKPYLPSPSEERKFRNFNSHRTTLAEDEFIMDLICSTPTQFDSLLCAPFTMETPEPVTRLPIRRCLSMFESSTPVSSKKLEPIQKHHGPLAVSSPKQVIQFKRPCSPAECLPKSKRRKLAEPNPFKELSNVRIVGGKPLALPFKPAIQISCSIPLKSPAMRSIVSLQLKSPAIQRSVSDSHLSIMKALNKSEGCENLTGDFSRPLALPILTSSKHPELRSISPVTMAGLLKGQYSEISSYQIVDCRYPYEYNGGHISNAINWSSLESANQFFESVSGPAEISPVESTRKIIIFHCEFSAERGPRAQRFLREVDRTAHKEQYPALHFPELYLLEGGYQAFFRLNPEMCSPQSYIKMLDENFSEDMKLCRAKSKNFAADSKFGKGRCTLSRTQSTKRFGLRHN